MKSLPRLHLAPLRARRDAFVLVAVLLLVALATVLVVVSTMMAHIERTAAANSAKTERARANALFALDVALNQLQTAAGPDQRITARAEILDSTPATTNVDGVNQPYWTGVWRTGNASLDIANSGTPQRQTSFNATSTSPTQAEKAASAVWLVSGTNTVSPVTFNDTTASSRNATAVVIARRLGAQSANVTVPLVAIRPSGNTSTTVGSYGFWVSDEGIKAKVNLSDPNIAASTVSRTQARFVAPHGTDTRKGVLGVNASPDLRSEPNLPRITTLASLTQVNGLSNFSSRNSSLDATTVSYGVLADVVRGGLKKDLTSAFENASGFAAFSTTYGNGATLPMLYRYATAAGQTVPVGNQGANVGITDGLPWASLFFFYNCYKGQMSSPYPVAGTPLPITPTSSGNPATQPNQVSPRAYGLNVGASTKQASLLPLPIAFRVDIALSSYNAGSSGSPDWRLRLHYYPQLVLYNPYTVRISAANFQFVRNFGAFATAGSFNHTSPTVTSIRINAVTPGAPPTTVTIPYFLVNQAANGRLQLATQVGSAAVMEPGETRVFGLDADASRSTPRDAITFANLVSTPNMSPDFSQYCDVLTTSDGTTGISAGAPYSTTDPNTTISVQLAAPSLRCQAVDSFIEPRSLKWPNNDGGVRFQAGGTYQQSAASSSWATIPISALSGAPRRIIGFYIRQKGIQQTSSTYTYTNAASLLPAFMGNCASFNPLEDSASTFWKEVYLSPLGVNYQNGQADVQMAPARYNSNMWETSFGQLSAGAGAPGTNVLLRDVPNQPLISLGQFMHMPTLNFLTIGAFAYYATGNMFVGGSLAHPLMPTSQNALVVNSTTSAAAGADTLFMDDSFLSNQELFDRFFLSTVPPSSLNAAGTTYPQAWTEFNSANSGSRLSDATKPLLNPRIRPYFNNGIAPLMDDLRNVDRAAANLLLDGAFNVNSTSVPAWVALLSSLSGNSFQVWNANSQGLSSGSPITFSSSTLQNPISRFWSAVGLGSVNQPWSGLRALSDSQVQELAARIVEEVKTRGPFLSMADFLNRRLGTASALTRVGALQAAIDKTSPDINAAMKIGAPISVSGGNPVVYPANMQDAQGNPWNSAIGIPGYLMQQDLVQAFSPVMTARSDTFTVRTYGEVRNQITGVVEGSAYGEAVVQRLPEYFDPSQPPETALAAANGINSNFGRRFRVVSFRWLNENEI